MHENDTIYYPQDEMTTFLLKVTTGCTHNKCSFCSMYKEDTYSEVAPLDIDMQLMNGYLYTEKVFLTGADPISIGFDKMKILLDKIHKHLPYCACVASYASIRNISKYSEEELSALHDKGLRLLYIGFETGRDDVLKKIHKGHTVEEAIEQGKKLNTVKLPFNAIIMYGIAGKDASVENAIATAQMLNQFAVKKIITMNLMLFHGTELKKQVDEGIFKLATQEERLLEIKTLLANIEPKKPTLFDMTHPTNIIKIKGMLPEDKERLIKEIEEL